MNSSNILVDDAISFVGLIDFNLSGIEPVLNYTLREALWAAQTNAHDSKFTTLVG